MKRSEILITPQALLDKLQDPGGGFTWHPRTGEVPTEGYAVSIYPVRGRVCISARRLLDEHLLAPVIQGFASFNGDAWDDDNHFLGAWHNPEDGLLYLDISVVVATPWEADDLCMKHGQKAFYDFAQKKSIVVDKIPAA